MSMFWSYIALGCFVLGLALYLYADALLLKTLSVRPEQMMREIQAGTWEARKGEFRVYEHRAKLIFGVSAVMMVIGYAIIRFLGSP